jgi:phosphosulfolactate phosphohydrolase-like enzyme
MPNDNHNVVLYSPNGAACAALGNEDDIILIGCLLNARSVGEHLSKIARLKERSVTVVAAGEQRAIDTGERIVYDKEAAYPVFAIEDYLASGAIISYADLKKSVEADMCQSTFRSARRKLKRTLFGSFSGRYLVQNGLDDDITHAAKLNLYDVVPAMHSGKITKL